ncbi:MAG: hypothetical protein ABL983_05360 [Nitrospira sp.]
MVRVPIVRPWSITDSKKNYTAFIAAVGYELRARYIAETYAPNANTRFAFAFPDRKVHHYTANYNWYVDAGYSVAEVTDESFAEWCKRVIGQSRQSDLTSQSLCIDISSLSRKRIAVLVDTLRRLDWVERVHVDFLYSLAEYSPPPDEIGPNTHVGPVLPSFAGWTTEPDRPAVAIVGLGYEEGKALGAVEHIQAAEVWAFEPVSPITQYSGDLEKANRTLLESIPRARRMTYPVSQPIDCFVILESLTNRLCQSSSPVLFPFGPKIFTLCALLVACLHPGAAVWRVSSEVGGEAADRAPSPFIFGLSVEFSLPS